jgi:hypothetical protein
VLTGIWEVDKILGHKGKKKMTAQIQHVIRRLAAHHGYSAVFLEDLGYGIYLYSFGGIVYRIRGDGTIL